MKAQLQAALQKVDAVVVLLTPRSVASKYVDWELEIAKKIGKPILPVLILDCVIPQELAPLHYRNLSNEQSYNQELLLLVKDLNQLKAD